MIIYLSRATYEYPLARFVFSGRAGWLTEGLRFLSYKTALRIDRFPRATYVFSDIDRLGATGRADAQVLWDRLDEAGLAARRLNEPRLYRDRHDLLRHLHAAGLNDVEAWRTTEIDGVHYPVFLRHPVEHTGPLSDALHDRASLDAAIDAYRARGIGEPLIVSWKPGRDAEGHFVKYGAFRVGARILARHRQLSETWQIKIRGVLREATFRAELDYQRANPHADLLMPVFETAGIEYGRLDYTMEDGRVRVFEINSNPLLPGLPGSHADERFNDLFIPAYLDAMAGIDTPCGGEGRISPVNPVPFWRRRRRSVTRDHDFAARRQMRRYGKGAAATVPPSG